MTETKAWQHGRTLEELRALTEPFRATDQPHVYGAFGAFKERDVASALAADELTWSADSEGRVVAAVAARVTRVQQRVVGFDKMVRATVPTGSLVLSRLACVPGGESALWRLVVQRIREESGRPWYVHIWQENPVHRRIVDALGARLVAVKIPASSELVGVWSRVPPVSEYDAVAAVGLSRLAVSLPDTASAVEALGRIGAYASHYSSYNKRDSWKAVSLRGYTDDPEFIIKPTEMSKGWKAEHADLLDADVRDTPLRAVLPELEPLIAAVPGDKQRIRLMQLAPGGGELTRHADITDPEAGTDTGQVMRIHVPLVTNRDVVFTSWGLDGSRTAVNMPVGEAWYLDTRKPHTAINGGASPRVHLVMDTFASDELCASLEEVSHA